MSFGYSVGDVIAGANLTYRLLRIMADTKGGSQEYIDAMSELSAMQQAFLQISHIRSQKMLQTSTINAASHIVLSSMETIAAFLEKSKHYQKILENPRSSQFQSSWYKAGWMLYKSHELKALRDTLHAKLTSVQVLLSAAAYSTPLLPHQVIDEDQTHPLPPYPTQHAQKPIQVKNEETLAANGSTPTLSESSHEEPYIISMLNKVRQEIIKDNEDVRFVHLTDAIGRKFKFPFDKAKTWAGFEEYVKQAFMQVEKLGTHVQAGRYDLAAADGTIILPSVWEDMIEPGMNVIMTMRQIEDSPPPLPRFPHLAPVWPPRRSNPPHRPYIPDPPSQRPMRTSPYNPPPLSMPREPITKFQGSERADYDSPDSDTAEASAVIGSSTPISHNNFLPHDIRKREAEVVKRFKQLGTITKPALMQAIRHLKSDSVITGEEASSMTKRIRSLRKGDMAKLIKRIKDEPFEPMEDCSVNSSIEISRDSGIEESKLPEASTIDDFSDAGTESTCGDEWSEPIGSEGNIRRKNLSWRRVRRKERGIRKSAKSNTAPSGTWEDCSDSEGP